MIRLIDVTKIYNQGRANEKISLNSINLEIASGESIMITGASGSGKSTLLSMISGISKPTSGIVEVFDEQISKLPDDFCAEYRRKSVGIIFQNYHLFENMSVIDNVSAPLFPTKMSYSEIRNLAERALDSLEMLKHKESSVSTLSGGEQQRTAIARAIINSPEIIIADEPTANLDNKLTEQFIEIMKKLSSAGHTLITATHDQKLIESELKKRAIGISDGVLQR